MKEIIVSIAEVKARLSEYISKSKYNHDRIIITKRNKPIAALVNIEDYHSIQKVKEQTGLAKVIGKWKNFDEISKSLSDIKKLRQDKDDLRDVSL